MAKTPLTPEQEAAKKEEQNAKRRAAYAAKKEAEAAVDNAPVPTADDETPAGDETPDTSEATTFAETSGELADRQAATEQGIKEKSTADAVGQLAAIADPDTKEGKLRAKGLAILSRYPDKQTIYMTANGFGFFNFNEANNHAKSIDDKTIITVNRE